MRVTTSQYETSGKNNADLLTHNLPAGKKFIGTSSILARGRCRVSPSYRPHMPGSNWNSSDFPSSRSARPPVCLSFEYNLQCPLLVPHLFPPYHRLFHWLWLLPYLNLPNIEASDIDLFTDTVAILDYLDLRSIMGWPGGHKYDSICSLSIYEGFGAYTPT